MNIYFLLVCTKGILNFLQLLALSLEGKEKIGTNLGGKLYIMLTYE